MKEQFAGKFLVAAPTCAQAKVQEILSAIGMEPDAVCASGEEVIAMAQEAPVLLLATIQLADMTGVELARRLGDRADMLLVVPGDYDEAEADATGALLLRNPITQDALYQALRATMHMQKKLLAVREREKKLERTLEDRKTVDKAKGRLMDELHLTEKQAHYHIQKKSMDMGRRIVDVAREILDAETLTDMIVE